MFRFQNQLQNVFIMFSRSRRWHIVGTVGLIYARSGMACKQDLAPANKVGVIDSDYRGEIMVALHNHGNSTRTVNPGDRIAQFVLAPVLTADFAETDSLEDTARGAGGFGSTGVN